MDDFNQQPNWQPGGPGGEILKQQAAEMEEARLAAEQKKEAAELAAREAAAAANLQQQREAERLTASIMLRQQAGEIEGAGPGAAPTAAIDKKIAELQKQTSTDYVTPYLFLTTGAAAVDILQFVCNASVILSLFASGLGVGFSVARHFGLQYANPKASKKEQDDMLNRTLISGVVSLIPIINALPEQTGIMIHEWTIKRLAIQAASQELTKLKIQRQKMLS